MITLRAFYQYVYWGRRENRKRGRRRISDRGGNMYQGHFAHKEARGPGVQSELGRGISLESVQGLQNVGD